MEQDYDTYIIVSRKETIPIALFYNKKIGKKRMYRRELNDEDKSFALLKYKRYTAALDWCNYANTLHNQYFQVETLNPV